jgi:hypothetical protein
VYAWYRCNSIPLTHSTNNINTTYIILIQLYSGTVTRVSRFTRADRWTIATCSNRSTVVTVYIHKWINYCIISIQFNFFDKDRQVSQHSCIILFVFLCLLVPLISIPCIVKMYVCIAPVTQIGAAECIFESTVKHLINS